MSVCKHSKKITLVHLSDIHFSERDNYSQIDLNQHIRRSLLEDLVSYSKDGMVFNGLLITGDVAFSGQSEEYARAKQWLDELYNKTETSPENTYVVPGNHDVDRSFVQPGYGLHDSHLHLRGISTDDQWDNALTLRVTKDPTCTLLCPFAAYNDFAQGYACATTRNTLSWSEFLPTSFEDGTRICLRGLNSALISHEQEERGKLLVSRLQTATLVRDPSIINVIMCHHPPDWLKDRDQIRDALNSFATIGLFGHEHKARVDGAGSRLDLFAGAVQPSRTEKNWSPTYHLIELSMTPEGQRRLHVRVHTREFVETGHRFRAWRNEKDRDVSEHAFPLQHVQKHTSCAYPTPAGSLDATASSTSEATRVSLMHQDSPPNTNPHEREMLVQFFRLSTPLRYQVANEAGLIRPGDDSRDPREMWVDVFLRAKQEGTQALLWDKIASRTTTLRDRSNPFHG